MPTLYLVQQNTILRKTSERFVVCRMRSYGEKKAGYTMQDVLLELPCADVDQVMVFGNVQITTQALRQLLEHGVECALFTQRGKLLGQVTPPKAKNIQLRIAQFEKYGQAEFQLAFSKKIVNAKIENGLTMLRNHKKNHPEMFTDAELVHIQQFKFKVKQADDPEQLRGFEGAASAGYFKLFGRMFVPPWKFNKRTRRPPRDPVNAVISFGYTIIGAEIQSLLDGVGFDPFLGFYHTAHYGRPSLALDLLEIFRHPLIDRLALNLFNRNILTEQDFFKPSSGGVYLNDDGKRKFFREYEKLMGDYEAETELIAGKPAFRAIFQKQVHALAKALQDEAVFEPYTI